jgi:imidazolonepropionase-like amidohydrolase
MRRRRRGFLIRFVFVLAAFGVGATAADAAATQAGVAAGTIAITGGTIIDGNGGRPMDNATVLIRGDRIAAVGPAGTVDMPADAKRFDAAGKFVLPGFIDLHVHLVYPRDGRQPSDSLSTLSALNFMEQFVDVGITSVRDVGGMIEPMQALNEAQRLGYIKSLRLYSVGQLITTTGGHGPKWSFFASGPYGFREAVRKMYDAGFRYIKLSPPYTQEEVSAAVDEAKIHLMRVTSHGGGFSDSEPPEMTRRAVLAGVQCIEHLYMPVADLDLIAARKIQIVPTLEIMKLLYESPQVIPTMDYLEHQRGWSMTMHEELFREAHKRHIVMGIGTDAIVELMAHYPGMYFDEMEYFVRLGMSRMETITAATKNGAAILGHEAELGTIEKGKLADLQVVEGNPLDSFQPLSHPSLVMIGGSVVRAGGVKP